MAASYALALDPEDLAGMFGSDDAYLAVSVRTDGAEDLGEFNVDKTFIQGVLADKGVVPVRAAPLQEPRVLFTEDELSLLCDDLAQHLAPVFGANLSRQLTAADWERASAHLPQGTTRSLVAPIVSAAVFAALDRKGAGVVSWQDYVQVLALMARGSTDDKLRLAFRMYGGSICLDSGIFRQRGEAFVERSLVLSHNSLDRRQMAQTLQDFANSLFASAALVGFDAFCQLAVVVPQVVSCFGLFDFVSFEVDSILSQRKAAQQREQLEQSESRLVLDLIQYGAAGAAVAGGLAAAADDDDDADGSLDSTDSPAPDQSDAAGKKRKRTGRDAGPPVVGKPHPERPDCSCKSCNRIRRNRESARAHQQRKNAKIVELESTNKSLQEQVTQLKALVSALQQQNVHLQNKCGTMDRQISALEAQLAATPAAAAGAPAASPSFGFHTPGLAMHGMMGTLAMASDGCN